MTDPHVRQSCSLDLPNDLANLQNAPDALIIFDTSSLMSCFLLSFTQNYLNSSFLLNSPFVDDFFSYNFLHFLRISQRKVDFHWTSRFHAPKSFASSIYLGDLKEYMHACMYGCMYVCRYVGM